ncbi:MAG: signal peptidase I [Terriglobia bacterium]
MDETPVPDEVPGEVTAAPPPRPPTPGLSLVRDIAISVVLAIILIVFIYQPVKVEGTSMMPGLTDQERIFINKYEYIIDNDAVRRGDLVVFHFPLDRTQSYIKRVIGVPGDTIEIADGIVLVNGSKLNEPYLIDEYRDHLSTPRELVPANDYFVLGDHRSSSSDSRMWGFVGRKDIYGKAVFIYWPLEKIGRVR